MELKLLDLFSGVGGFSYAAEKIIGGYKTTQFVEIDPYCQSVLRKNFPNTPIHDDIKTFTAKPGEFDVFTIGFPCQDLSVAGKQRGINERTRSGLFYESIRLLREVRPRFALFENVRNLLSHEKGETFQEVLFQIAKAGYNAEWSVVSAKDLGACHLRERVWIVAYSNDYGQQRGEYETRNQNVTREDSQVKWSTNTTDVKRSSDNGLVNQESRIDENLSGSSDGGKTSSTNTRGVRELHQGTDNNKGISSQDIYQENNDRTLVSEGQSRIQLSNRRELGRNQTTSEDNQIRHGDDNNRKQRMENQRSNVTNSNSDGSSSTTRLRIDGETNSSSQKGENKISKSQRSSKSGSSRVVQQTTETSDSTNSIGNGAQGNCEEMEPPIWKNAFLNSKERRTLSPNWQGYVSEPCLCRGDDGLSNRVARIKAMGNSIVPACAAVPLQRIKDLDEELW
jgi:DNA (cytosine-5)-methyltransferase 1